MTLKPSQYKKTIANMITWQIQNHYSNQKSVVLEEIFDINDLNIFSYDELEESEKEEIMNTVYSKTGVQVIN